MTLRKSNNILQIRLSDKGKKYDMRTAPTPDLGKNLSGEKKGGFGVFLMKTLMDKILYKYHGDRNITLMCKKLSKLKKD